jgi:hypothetical protein
MSTEPQMDKLKQLADYQDQKGGLVLFKLRVDYNSQPVRLFVHDAAQPTGEPILEIAEMKTFSAWAQAGFIDATSGGLNPPGTNFKFTGRGLEAAGRG